MKERFKSVAGIAAAYAGTLFGAGFVSGQEILRFFAAWGSLGILGALIAGAGFAALGAVIMGLARRLGTADYERVVSPVGGALPKIIEVLISTWLFGVITVMLAAAGTLFETLTNLPALLGAAILTAAVLVVNLLGAEGFTRALSAVVPVMIALGFGTAAAGAFIGPDATLQAGASPDLAVAPHWLVSAALYISYNILGPIGVLAPLGRKTAREGDVRLGALIGGGVPGLFAALLCAAMLKNQAVARAFDMPMFAIARGISPALGYVYAGVLFLGIFTATSGISFSLLSRLSAYRLPGILGKRAFLVSLVCALAFALSRLGFASLVGTVYPVYGWLGFAVIALMIVNRIRARKLPQSGGERASMD
ncbi:MAG TPA: hypothetical protein VN540_09240 [Clostridia bacterium]|nr:hypothetical protein [Clostridia bacterium]